MAKMMYGGENYSDVPLDDHSEGHLQEIEELLEHGKQLIEQYRKEDEAAKKPA